MKKKLLIGFAALVLALVAAFNINLNTKGNTLSSLSLANVEALARYELPEVEIVCSSYECNKCYSENWDGIRYWCQWEGRAIYYCKFC